MTKITPTNDCNEHSAAIDVISDERLAEIRGLINWTHSWWRTLPSGPSVTKYELAAAVEDLLAERDDRV